jgi:hypothetical protein
MKLFKYCCAILALVYLVSALAQASFFAAPKGAEQIALGWVASAISLLQSLLLGIMFYGVHTRNSAYRTLVPRLMVTFLLTGFIPALWSAVRLSLPLTPFFFIAIFIFIGAVFFVRWWQNQKSYFA